MGTGAGTVLLKQNGNFVVRSFLFVFLKVKNSDAANILRSPRLNMTRPQECSPESAV